MANQRSVQPVPQLVVPHQHVARLPQSVLELRRQYLNTSRRQEQAAASAMKKKASNMLLRWVGKARCALEPRDAGGGDQHSCLATAGATTRHDAGGVYVIKKGTNTSKNTNDNFKRTDEHRGEIKRSKQNNK